MTRRWPLLLALVACKPAPPRHEPAPPAGEAAVPHQNLCSAASLHWSEQWDDLGDRCNVENWSLEQLDCVFAASTVADARVCIDGEPAVVTVTPDAAVADADPTALYADMNAHLDTELDKLDAKLQAEPDPTDVLSADADLLISTWDKFEVAWQDRRKLFQGEQIGHPPVEAGHTYVLVALVLADASKPTLWVHTLDGDQWQADREQHGDLYLLTEKFTFRAGDADPSIWFDFNQDESGNAKVEPAVFILFRQR